MKALPLPILILLAAPATAGTQSINVAFIPGHATLQLRIYTDDNDTVTGSGLFLSKSGPWRTVVDSYPNTGTGGGTLFIGNIGGGAAFTSDNFYDQVPDDIDLVEPQILSWLGDFGYYEAPIDTDGDGISDEDEIAAGTDPEKPDTDDDGFSDPIEAEWGTDPTDPDDDPVNDGGLNADFDGDGVVNHLDPDPIDPAVSDPLWRHFSMPAGEYADPFADADADGVPNYADGAPFDPSWYGTSVNPADALGADQDFDGDGISNFDEYIANGHPLFHDANAPVLIGPGLITGDALISGNISGNGGSGGGGGGGSGGGSSGGSGSTGGSAGTGGGFQQPGDLPPTDPDDRPDPNDTPQDWSDDFAGVGDAIERLRQTNGLAADQLWASLQGLRAEAQESRMIQLAIGRAIEDQTDILEQAIDDLADAVGEEGDGDDGFVPNDQADPFLDTDLGAEGFLAGGSTIIPDLGTGGAVTDYLVQVDNIDGGSFTVGYAADFANGMVPDTARVQLRSILLLGVVMVFLARGFDLLIKS